jgi:hypothetical protein
MEVPLDPNAAKSESAETPGRCIENLIGTVRHVTRNIKRWRDGDMRRRWIGLGLLRAAERFRRIKRHGELDGLVTALGAANLAERAA